MAIHTKLNDLLKIEHPIMLAGMAGVAYSDGCAAVCNAGGYGTLGAANMTIEEIKSEAKKVRDRLKKNDYFITPLLLAKQHIAMIDCKKKGDY